MNIEMLRFYMIKHGDNQKSLAEFLGITQKTIGQKMKDDESRNDFTQSEIARIAKRYSLTPFAVYAIFFADECAPSCEAGTAEK